MANSSSPQLLKITKSPFFSCKNHQITNQKQPNHQSLKILAPPLYKVYTYMPDIPFVNYCNPPPFPVSTFFHPPQMLMFPTTLSWWILWISDTLSIWTIPKHSRTLPQCIRWTAIQKWIFTLIIQITDVMVLFEESYIFVITKPFILRQTRIFLVMFALAMVSLDMFL